MFWAMWRREWRGARPRWWQHPWLPPLLFTAAIHWFRFIEAGHDDLLYLRGKGGDYLVDLAEVALACWALWVIALALTRDRRAGPDVHMGATPVRPAEILWAKVLAPSAAALACLITLRLTNLETQGSVALTNVGWRPAPDGTELASLALQGRVVLATALGPLVLLALAGWAATRARALTGAWLGGFLAVFLWMTLTAGASHVGTWLVAIGAGFVLAYFVLLADSTAIAVLIQVGLAFAYWQIVTTLPAFGNRPYARFGSPAFGDLFGRNSDIVRLALCFIVLPLGAAVAAFGGIRAVVTRVVVGISGAVVAFDFLGLLDPRHQSSVHAVAGIQVFAHVYLLIAFWLWTRGGFARLYFREVGDPTRA